MRSCARVDDEIADARASSNGITTVRIEVVGCGGDVFAPGVVKTEAVCTYVRDVNRAFVVVDSNQYRIDQNLQECDRAW